MDLHDGDKNVNFTSLSLGFSTKLDQQVFNVTVIALRDDVMWFDSKQHGVISRKQATENAVQTKIMKPKDLRLG